MNDSTQVQYRIFATVKLCYTNFDLTENHYEFILMWLWGYIWI